MNGRKTTAVLLALILVLLMVPFSASSDVAGWRILDSQQDNDTLDVWFATDEQISSGRVIYNYGGISLDEMSLSTTESVGYIFIVDNTSYYSQASIKDPKVLIEGAAARMSNYDKVAILGVRQEDLGKTPEFVPKGSWDQAYTKTFGTKATSTAGTQEYTYEAISKGISFALEMYQTKQVREMVMILITDGAARGKSKTSENCVIEIQRLPFTMPVYCLHMLPNRDEGKFIEFVNQLEMSTNKTVTRQNASSVGGECVIPYSNLIYKSRLKLKPEIYSAQSETLTISLAGSQKGARQDAISLNWSQIPTPTPEPTPTPSPTPTPEINPQFVGDGVGSEHDIWELQKVLIKLGFMDGVPTGVWDIATSSAVNLYYSMNGIGTDRIPAKGGMTKEVYDELMRLAEEEGTINTPTPTPSPTPTLKPTPTPTINPEKDIYIGYDTEDRALIRQLNKRLKELYYLDPAVEGSVYSDATQEAVDDFYKDHPELPKPENGEGITKNAYEALLQASPKLTPVPTVAPTEDPYPAYISYSSENANLIAELNQALLDRYFVADPSRIVMDRYNDETDAAVRAFYDYYEKIEDKEKIPRPSTGAGITQIAYEYLLGSQPRATATPIPDLLFVYNEESMKSQDALKVAKRLAELGYMESFTGDPDEKALRTAVVWFADRNGITSPGEYMSKAVYDAIMSSNARPAEDPPEELVPGSSEPEDQIIQFQDALKRLKYYRDIQEAYISGTFDEPTQKAYRRFCDVNGISWDGGNVSWAEQQKVLESEMENPALDLFENTKTFVTGYYELFGIKVPMWALLAAGVLILAAVVVVVVLLVKGKKKEAGDNISSTGFQPENPAVNVSMDAPTDDLGGGGIVTGLDAPTVDPEGCVLSLMITDPNGISRDVSYNLADGESLVIGRGSTADIVTDTEDLSVSRKHGLFRYSSKMVSYEDTSSHYSVLDGERIHLESRQLNQGSQLQIGKSQIKVQWS